MARTDRKHYVGHILFWSWEYARRHNPEEATAKATFMSFLKGQDLDSFVYSNSTQILDDVLECRLEYMYIPYGVKHKQAVRNIHIEFHENKKLRCELDKLGLGLDTVGKEVVTIDFSVPVKQIIAEIKSLHVAHMQKKRFGEIRGHSIHDDAFAEGLRSAATLKKLSNRLDRDLPRAIGLWLWDYLKDRKLGSRSFYKARKAFENAYRMRLPSDKSYSDEGQLKQLFISTSKCIQKNKVLSLSDP